MLLPTSNSNTDTNNLERLARIKAHRLSQKSVSFDSSAAASHHSNINSAKLTQANLQSSANQTLPVARQELASNNSQQTTLSETATTAATPPTDPRQLQGCNSLLALSNSLLSKGVEPAKADRQHHRSPLTGSDERKRKKIDSVDSGSAANSSGSKPDTYDKRTKPNESRSISTETDNMTPSSMLLLQNHNYIEGQTHRSATTYNELNHTSRESTASSNTSTTDRLRTIVLGCGPASSSSNDHSDSNISLQHCNQPNHSLHKSSSSTMPNINDTGCYDAYCYCYNYSQQPVSATQNHQYHLAASAGAAPIEPTYAQQSHPLPHTHLPIQQQQTQPLHTQHQQQAHSPHDIVPNQHSSYHQLANKAASVNHMYGNPVNAAATQYPSHLHNSVENHESNHHLIADAHQNHLDTAAAACAAAAVVSQTLKTVANHHTQQAHYASTTSNSFGSSNTGSLMNISAPHHQQFHTVSSMNHNPHHLMSRAPIANGQSTNVQVHHPTSVVTRKYQCKMCPQVSS